MAIYKEGLIYLISAAAKEAAYGTAAAVDRKIRVARPTPVREVATVETDEDFSTGLEGPSASVVTEKAWVWEPEFPHVKADDMGIWLSYALGSPASDVADTSAYVHAYGEGALNSRALPSFTLQEAWLTGTLQKVYAGGLVEQLRISWAAGTPLRMSARCLFSSIADETDTANATAETAICNGAGAASWIGAALEGSYAPTQGAADVTTPADMAARLHAWEMTITNIGDRRVVRDGRSLVPNLSQRGLRGITLRVTLEANDRTELSYVQAQTEKGIEWEWDSGVLAGAATQNYGFQFIWPKVRFQAYTDAWDAAGKLRQSFDCTLMDDATNRRVLAAVWNKVAEYAA
jgi:hypothetical protein